MSYEQALRFTLDMEGGLVDDPHDRGGLTNMGVTQATYDDWRRRQGLAGRSVRRITEDEVRRIYRDDYWDAAGCDALEEKSAPLAVAQFDAAVNHGPRRAVRLLQRALGIDDDGILGPATQAAVEAATGPLLLMEMLHEREDFYVDIVLGDRSQLKFLRGWINRVQRLRRAVCG